MLQYRYTEATYIQSNKRRVDGVVDEEVLGLVIAVAVASSESHGEDDDPVGGGLDVCFLLVELVPPTAKADRERG